jgi:hypothetical protein
MLPRPHSQRTYTLRTHWQQQLLGGRESYPRAKLEPKGQSNHHSSRSVRLECAWVRTAQPLRGSKPASRLDQPLELNPEREREKEST